MTYDLTRESPLFLLKEVPKLKMIGPRRNGGRLDVRTVYRWATTGSGGVILETLMQGGQRYTSEVALVRFFGAVTAARSGRRQLKAHAFQSATRGNNQVETELDNLGI